MLIDHDDRSAGTILEAQAFEPAVIVMTDDPMAFRKVVNLKATLIQRIVQRVVLNTGAPTPKM